LLVLGGTKFLGRAVVEAALGRGHDVTLFNRGQTNPELFPEVERLRGDRDGDLEPLRGRTWDAVVDPSGFVPRVVRQSADLLRDAVAHYVFVSSISVYRDPLPPGFDESAPLIELEHPDGMDPRASPEAYGGLKALCEEVVRDVFPHAHANIRAGLIVGPHDPSGRFTYWVLRLAAGGRVIAPAPPERLVQVIDVRDLAAWMVTLAEERTTGTFNAVSRPFPFSELVEAGTAVAGSDADVVWVDESLLLEHDVGPWMQLPLWVPTDDAGFLQANVSAALAHGLTTRDLADTVRDTLEWARATGAGLVTPTEHGEVGLPPALERELLDSWAAASTP
jgi:2'-hydroxyisoflavone reductase